MANKNGKKNAADQPDDQTALALPADSPFATLMAAVPAEAEVLRDADGRAVGADVETDKLEVPRLALVQKQSKVTDEKLAEAGDIMATLSVEVLWPLPQHTCPDGNVPAALLPFVIPGSAPPQLGLPFLPLRNFTDQVSFADDFSLQCRSLPGGLRPIQGFKSPDWKEGDTWDAHLCSACPLKDWGEGGEKPRCDLTYNTLGFALNTQAADPEGMMGMPVALALARTSLKTGRAMATTIKLSNKNPWAYIWVLWATLERNDSGSFYVWRARQAVATATGKALATPAPMAAYAAEVYTALAGQRVDIDRTGHTDVEQAPVVDKAIGTEGVTNSDPWDNSK